MPTTEDRARKIVAEHLEVDPAKVTAGASFVDDLGADSLDLVELIMAFEEEFDIAIPDEKAYGAASFGEALKLVEAEL